MKNVILKFTFSSIVFTVAFLGIRLSQRNISVANEQSSVTSVRLGQQVQAYCNEIQYTGEKLTGKCDGAFNSSTSRCLSYNFAWDCAS